MDEPDDLTKSIILQFLNNEFNENPRHTFLAPEISIRLEKILGEYGYDTIEKTEALIRIMTESGQLREENSTYTITNKGRDDLQTIYNDDWIVSQMNKYKIEKEKNEKEKIEQFKLEERRHQEVVKAASEGNKIQRISIWIALGLGAAGLIIAIFKP